MTHNILDYTLASSDKIEADIGRKLEALRLALNISQDMLGEESGTSRSTIARLGKEGKGISVNSLIRIMKSLGIVHHLEHLIPEQDISPLQLIEQKPPKVRKRARETRTEPKQWIWEDDR